MLRVVGFKRASWDVRLEGSIPVSYSVEYADGILKLGVSGQLGIVPVYNKTVEMDLSGVMGKVFQAISIDMTDEYNDLKVGEIFNQVDNRSLFKTKVDGCKVADVIVEENGDVLVVLLISSNNISYSGEVELFDRETKPVSKTLREISPYYDKVFVRQAVKGKFLNKVDIYNSVSYLEAQVDVLTRAVLAMTSDADLKQMLEAADAHSVLDLKTKDDIVLQLAGDKERFRQMQREYYKDKTRSDE